MPVTILKDYHVQILEEIRAHSSAYKWWSAPLNLGGSGGTGGGSGAPPGGIFGQLIQSKVAYDTTEAAYLGLPNPSGASLVDNLAHIRMSIQTLSGIKHIHEDGVLVTSTATILDFDPEFEIVASGLYRAWVGYGTLLRQHEDRDHYIEEGAAVVLYSGAGNFEVGRWESSTGDITISGQFKSGKSTGDPPLVVESTTKVTNLNVDLLDDQSGAYYLDSDNFTGTDWTDLTDAGETALHTHAGSMSAHDIQGAYHVASGLSVGHVLRASGATAFSFAELQHTDLGGVTVDLHHNEAHVLAVTGPHTGELPLTDLAAGTQGGIIRRGASDWEEYALGTTNYVLKAGATDVVWGQVAFSELTGDIVYTQLDSIVDTSGGGSASMISAAEHIHTDADGSTKVGHANLSGVTTDQHHAQSHVLDGGDHTVSGQTIGNVLTALSATTFGFQAPDSQYFTGTDWTDLTDAGETSLHTHAAGAPAAHVLDGALHTVSGLTPGDVLTALTATTFGFQAPAAPAAHVLATSGPHTGELPWADMAAGTQGSIIKRGASDWEEYVLGTTNYVLKAGATDVAWGQVAFSELTGDIVYTQLDSIVDTSGGGSANYISSAEHVHTDVDGSTKVGHGNLSGVSIDQHHARDHDIEGSTHTATGLTIGHVMRASGATTFSFAALQASDIPSLDHGSDLTGLDDDDHGAVYPSFSATETITGSWTFSTANPIFDIQQQIKGIVAPGAGPAGYGHFYAKTDGKLYWHYAGGSEIDLTLGGVGTLDLDDLGDVTIASPSDGQTLYYDNGTSQWKNTSSILILPATTEVQIQDVVKIFEATAGLFLALRLANPQAAATDYGVKLTFEGDTGWNSMAELVTRWTGASNDNSDLRFYIRVSDSTTEKMRLDTSDIKFYDDLAFQQASTISTTSGDLTLDPTSTVLMSTVTATIDVGSGNSNAQLELVGRLAGVAKTAMIHADWNGGLNLSNVTGQFIGFRDGSTLRAKILSTGSFEFQQASTISTTTGNLNINPSGDLVLEGTGGYQFDPGSDIDIYMLRASGITGAPSVWWDESDDKIAFTHGIYVLGEVRNTSTADASPYTQTRISVYRDESNWGYLAYGADAHLRVVYSKTVSGQHMLWGTSSANDGTGTFTTTMCLEADGDLLRYGDTIFQQASTISTSTGDLTIDPAGYIYLQNNDAQTFTTIGGSGASADTYLQFRGGSSTHSIRAFTDGHLYLDIFTGKNLNIRAASGSTQAILINSAGEATIYEEFTLEKQAQIKGITAPGAGPAGYGHFYAKTDGKLYWHYAGGSEVDLTLGGVGTLDLDDLGDVTITSPADGHTLYYDNGTSLWKNTNVLNVKPASTAVEITGDLGIGITPTYPLHIHHVDGAVSAATTVNHINVVLNQASSSNFTNIGRDTAFLTYASTGATNTYYQIGQNIGANLDGSHTGSFGYLMGELVSTTLATGAGGSVGDIYTIWSQFNSQASVTTTVTNYMGLYVTASVTSGSITNAYGVKIGDIDFGGTLNHAIYTGTGDVSFGDDLEFRQHAVISTTGSNNLSLTPGGGLYLQDEDATNYVYVGGGGASAVTIIVIRGGGVSHSFGYAYSDGGLYTDIAATKYWSMRANAGGTQAITIQSDGHVDIHQYVDISGEIRNTTAADASPYTQTRMTVYRDSGNWGYLGYGADASLRIVQAKTGSGGNLLFGTTSASDGTGTFTNTLALSTAGDLFVYGDVQFQQASTISTTSGDLTLDPTGNINIANAQIHTDTSTNLTLMGKRQSAGVNSFEVFTPGVSPGWTDTSRLAITGGYAVSVAGFRNVEMSISPGTMIVSPDGTLHVYTASAGTVAANSGGDDLIVENSDDGGISILTPDGKWGQLIFGSPSGNKYAWISAQYTADSIAVIGPGGGTVELGIDGSPGSVVVNQAGDQIDFRVESDQDEYGIYLYTHPSSTEMLYIGGNSMATADASFTLGGGLAIGNPTDGDKGAGSINVDDDYYKDGTSITADYILEHYYKGEIIDFIGNINADSYKGLQPINVIEKFMQKNLKLPWFSGSGDEGLIASSQRLLVGQETMMLHIIELEARITELEEKLKEGK